MTLHLIIPGPPHGQARPRFSRRTGHAYAPKSNVMNAGYIRAMFASKYPDHAPFEGPVEMELLIYFPIPASASKKRRQEMLRQLEMPTKKPDCSNVLKLAEDALNGLAYTDDKNIVSARVAKAYSDRPRLEINIVPMEDSHV